ncbi:unnamed protein product [Calicophoron daubneyi]|uniref:ENTH domain-containing protein n=1 Tax=Calicophoron daubneyi TaxID=300641 RepID=A0AAV2TH51_CALDB
MAGKVVKQLAGSGTGQSLSDIMTAMKHTLSGSLVAKIICKATTEEMIAPKRKHLAYLVQCTFEPRLSVPDFANYLVGRTQHSNLVVVFKAFITIHHLMQYGSERFSQYIASNNSHFYLPSLSDRGTFQTHGVGAFIRPYAKYLDEKAASYREIATDLCRAKLGKGDKWVVRKEDGDIRNMPQNKLFKTLPVIERQLDSLLAFDATSNELVNSVLRVAHLHLYRDLIRLYAVYNEAMINLIGRYFTMSKKDCRTSLTYYKAFLKRMESMNTFVKVAEAADNSGFSLVHEADCITFQPVPPSVLEALEQHLAHLEGHKSTEKHTGDKTNALPGANAIFSDPNETGGSTLSNRNSTSTPFVLTATERHHIIEEERARLESFVSSAHKQALSSTEAEMRNAADQLKSLSSDAEFVDLLASSGPELPVSAPAEAGIISPWPTPAQMNEPLGLQKKTNSNLAWSTPSVATGPQANDSKLHTGVPVLDFSETPDPFSTSSAKTFTSFSQQPVNMAIAFPSATGGNSVSKNPFLLPNPMNGVPSTTESSPFGSNAWYPNVPPQISNLGPSQPATWKIDFESAFPPSKSTDTGEDRTPKSTLPTSCETTSVLDPLDAKLAQLAGSLSIGSGSESKPSSTASYRAPDGSLTAVNWTGVTQSAHPLSSAGVRNSVSLNQLTGPAVQPSVGSTNPWAVVPSQPVMGRAPGYSVVPIGAYPSVSYNTNGLLPIKPTGAQFGQSTNPFL